MNADNMEKQETKSLIKGKKAELTTEMLVGIALVIVLIIVALAIISGKFNFFNQNTDCNAQGGECKSLEICTGGRLYGATCENDKEVCCLKSS